MFFKVREFVANCLNKLARKLYINKPLNSASDEIHALENQRVRFKFKQSSKVDLSISCSIVGPTNAMKKVIDIVRKQSVISNQL